MSIPTIRTAPRVHPVCQVAVGNADIEVGQARYDTSRYDQGPDATYAGLDPEWFDVSCEVFDATTYIGRERTVDVFDIGTANLTVSNESGWADYPSTGATVLSVRPGRQIRIGVDVDGLDGPFWLWRGWIDRTEPGYDPVAGDVVYIDCVDAKGEYGRAELVRYDVAVGGGESVVTRLNRVADLAQVPAHRRQFDPAGAALRATQLGGRAGAQYDTAARSGGGNVFGDGNGFLTYRGQDWLSFPADRPADARIGNMAGDDDVCPNGWEVSFERADFTTRVIYGRTGEEARTIDDVANRDLYGVETFNLTGLDTDDGALLDLIGARALEARSFDLAPRIAAVALDAARRGVPELLVAADPFAPSLYTCVHVDDGVERFARTMYLTGVEHTITATHWTARLALDDATPYLQGSDARYDTAHYNLDRYAKAA